MQKLFHRVPQFPHLVEDSPDGLIECDGACNGQCRNLIGYPIGKLSVEVKCPYSPMNNPTLLPIAYEIPHYNGCQVLTHMKCTNSNVLLFVSCGIESLSVSFVDFDDGTWNKLFNFTKEMYADPEMTIPTQVQLESMTLKEDIKVYCKSNSVLVAEVPTMLTVDDECLSTSRMPTDRNKMYRYRKSPTASTPDWKIINEGIVDMCDKNVNLLEKANEILRRKATELLLFVASDSDRQFNKDIPSCIPIAYGLKGKSIRIETTRKMINVVQNALNRKNIRVLAESLDGQWAPIVFRDSDNNPLTVYKFDKDCWSKFLKMGKSNLLRYMETFSHISARNIEGLAKPERFEVG